MQGSGRLVERKSRSLRARWNFPVHGTLDPVWVSTHTYLHALHTARKAKQQDVLWENDVIGSDVWSGGWGPERWWGRSWSEEGYLFLPACILIIYGRIKTGNTTALLRRAKAEKSLIWSTETVMVCSICVRGVPISLEGNLLVSTLWLLVAPAGNVVMLMGFRN